MLLPSSLLACILNTQEYSICPPRGRQAAIFSFSRLPYLALGMVLNRQVVVAMVTPITPAAKLRKGHKG